MQKKLFSIEWPDEFGAEWLSLETLNSFFTSQAHVNQGSRLIIEDVTIPPPEPQPTLGGHDL